MLFEKLISHKSLISNSSVMKMRKAGKGRLKMKKLAIYREGNPFMEIFAEKNGCKKVALSYNKATWTEEIKKAITFPVDEVWTDITVSELVKAVTEKIIMWPIKVRSAYDDEIGEFDQYLKQLLVVIQSFAGSIFIIDSITDHLYSMFYNTGDDWREKAEEKIEEFFKKNSVDFHKLDEVSLENKTILADHHVVYRIGIEGKKRLKLVCPCCIAGSKTAEWFRNDWAKNNNRSDIEFLD